jgi:transposase
VDTSERAVVKRVPQRRRRAVEEKRRIVEETLQPGASVACVARAHAVNANQVFAWRRQYWQGLLELQDSGTPGLLAVRVGQAATPGHNRYQ